MADSIVRLRVDSQEYDNKLKRAAEGLNRYIEGCRKVGGTLEHVDDGVKEFTQQLGKMGTVAGGAKGKLGEMTKAFTDLTMQFNEMSEAEKHGQFGKALSAGLDELKQRIISTKQELADINSSLNGGAIGSGGSLFSSDKLSGMLQVFGGNLMTKGAGMALSFAGELKDMVAQGIELAKQGEGIRIAFQRLGRGDILDGLREATHGTVTDLELMKAAVKFNDFKLPLDELGTMLAFAQQKAKDTGQSVDYMVDSIVTGLGRKSLMILDNLGLSASEVKDRMAETGDMTKAVGAIIREQMAKAGDYVETAADRATQANVSLQNKMEELGRKFGPLEQASSNLWTSIKIGIMDIVGGPLTEFLNKLTEAGRLAQKYSVLGGSGKVGRMINNLSGAREGNRQSIYQQQQEQFWRYINPREQQIRDIRAWQRGERGEALQKRVTAITEKYGSLDATKIQAEVDAARKMLAEYQQSAKQILTPVKADIKTDDAEQNVASLTKKLKELQEQRKKAIAAGDTELSKNLLKQINQVKADIKGLGGTTTTTTTTTHQTPQQRAQESFTKAEQNYKQALEQAALELQAGTITRAEAKKKEMQAAEARWKAIGDARNINDSDRLRQAQDEAAATYKALAAEVKIATERQKAIDKATRDLENANQKLAAARQEMAQAKQQGDLQAYNTAKDKAAAAQNEITRLEKVKVNVETGTVNLPDIPKVIEQTVNTHQGEMMTAEIAKEITQTINTRLGRIVTPDILESITQTINTKIGRVVTPAIAKELTQVVNVKTGKVDLPDIPKVIEQTVNTHQGEMMTAEIAKEITQTINTRLGRIVTPDILESITQTINTKIGRVVTPAIAKELTQVVNVKTGKVDLPDIPKVIEQTVNTHQGELMTAEIAKEITQTINTRLGRIVTPDILESITQTINTKVGNVITPEIAKEVTQVVNVETGTVNLPEIPATTTTTVDFEANTRNIDAAISYVKKEMDTIPVGTIAFNLDQTKLADLTTLKTLISEQMKNGLQIDPNFAQSMFSNILAGKDIENTTWQAQVDNINKNRTANGRTPLKINYKTGEENKKEDKQNKKDEKKDLSVYQDVSRIAGSVQGMLTTLEQLGVKIPDELKGIMSGVQSIIEFMSATSSFVSAVAGIKMFGFAHGGMIKAYSGTLVGNTYSGDQLRGIDNQGQLYGLNAGEVVLNRAQTGNIASQLSGNNGGGQNAQPFVTGDIIYLGLQNYLQENGYGKIVTTNMR